MIPYGRQQISEEDIESVVEVLRSDFLTQGPKVPEFEHAVAKKVGAHHAIAVNSATSALHLACKSLGLGPGDWLWTSPITFVASANCGLYCGADVDFVDIDARTYNISIDALAKKLSEASARGTLPKVVVIVHLCGEPCDMAQVHNLSQKYGFKIIEDASHAIGSKYQGRYTGSCQYSDITVFSLHPVKIITAAEGGLALTNNAELADRMELLRSHGITRDPARMTKDVKGAWYYQQVDLGFNYRMTELQAALGASQFGRLDQFVERRHELAMRYNEMLQGLPLTLPYLNPQNYSALHLYVVRLKLHLLGCSRAEIFERLRERGIGVNVHYIPVHTQPFYAARGFQAADYPLSMAYYEEALTLPLYSGLSDEQQQYVVDTVKQVISELGR